MPTSVDPTRSRLLQFVAVAKPGGNAAVLYGSRNEQEMPVLKLTSLSLIAAIGFSRLASASMIPLPVPAAESAIMLVGESCGFGGWRSGLDNRCRPMGPYGHGAPGYVCPAGWHIGPRGGACWPNR